MAFPSEATADRQTGTNPSGTNHTVTLPTNLQAGDIIQITLSLNDGTTTVSVPAGYTKQFDLPPLVEITREADGNEGASITVTTGDSAESSYVSRRITGGDHAGIEAAAQPSDGSDINTASPDPPNLAPSGGADDYLWIATFGVRVDNKAFSSYPTNYSDGATASVVNATRAASATRQLNAASEDPGAFSLSSNVPAVAVTMAIPPSGPSAATLAERAGTDDENAALSVTGGDTSASEHELYRSTSAMSGDPEANGTLIQDGISAASAAFDLTDNEANSTSGPSPDTVYHYALVTRDGSGGTAVSNEVQVRTAPERPAVLIVAPSNLVAVQGADPAMFEDDSGNGVVNGFTETNTADNGVPSVDSGRLAQRLEITNQTGGSELGAGTPQIPVTPGKDYTASVECEFDGLSSAEIAGKVLFVFRDSNGLAITPIPGSADLTNTSMTRITHTETAPSGAATLEVRHELYTTGDASGDSGTGWFRRIVVYEDEGAAVGLTSLTVVGVDATQGLHRNRLWIWKQGAATWGNVDRTIFSDEGEDFEHTFEDLEVGATYEIGATALNVSTGDESGFTTITQALSGKPDTPTCSVDAVGETTADLSSSAFSDPQGDAHAASQWQVDTGGGNFSAPVFDSGEDASNLTSIVATGLTAGTAYDARVRHKDDQGDWSDWSAVASFTTSTNQPPAKPVLSVDVAAQTTADLSGSGYSDPEGDPHANSQWQVDEAAGDFSTPVFDSGTDPTNLTSVQATGLTPGTSYQARVRYQDDQGGWSPWSDPQTFATQATGVTVRSGSRVRPADILLGLDFAGGKEGVYSSQPDFSRGAAHWVRSVKAGGSPLYVPARGNQVPYRRMEVEGVLAPTRLIDLQPGHTPTNDDSAKFLPSDSTWNLSQGSESDMEAGVGSVFDGHTALRWRTTAEGDRINDTGIGDGDGGRQTVQMVIGLRGLPSGREVQVRLKDDTAGSAVATCLLDVDNGTVSGTGDVYGERLTDHGLHGDEVWLLVATGATVAGNSQSMWLEPAKTGSGGDAYLYQAIHHALPFPVAPIPYEGAPPSVASDDLTVARIQPESFVGYTRFVCATFMDGSARAIWSNGPSTTSKLQLQEDTTAGQYEMIARDGSSNLANPAIALGPSLGQLVELAVAYTHATGALRLLGRVDGGAAVGAADTPASWTPPNQWAADRRYNARTDGTLVGRQFYERDLVVRKAGVDSPTDGSDDDALLDELSRVTLPPYGSPT